MGWNLILYIFLGGYEVLGYIGINVELSADLVSEDVWGDRAVLYVYKGSEDDVITVNIEDDGAWCNVPYTVHSSQSLHQNLQCYYLQGNFRVSLQLFYL